MMKAYEGLPAIRETFQEASDVLGQDLWKMVDQGPAESLNQTVNTQPVMLAAGIAVYRAWQSTGGKAPAILAGHSFGEYSALVASGALAFRDALPLARYRAQAMQEAVSEDEGGMAALLGLDDALVDAVCAEAAQGQVLEPANLNSPEQVVIAGHKEAVLRGCEVAKAKGAKRAIMLAVSVPVHCSLMRPAGEKLGARLEQITLSRPQIPVIQNADVASYSDSSAIKDALVRQLYSPVRWIETVRLFAACGVDTVVECGPGRVLGGLTKRIDGALQSLMLHNAEALRDASAQL